MILSLQSWWSAMTQSEQVFWAIAIIASAFFLVQFVLALIGLDHDADTDFHGDVHGDFDADAGGGFTLISIRSLAAFLMFFGWGGVAALMQGLSLGKAVMVASLFGLVAMVGVAYILSLILKLQESGTVHLSEAKRKIGDVYVPIPALGAGTGRIQLSLEGKVMEFDAVTEEEELATGTKVEVVEVRDDHVMVVRPVEQH